MYNLLSQVGAKQKLFILFIYIDLNNSKNISNFFSTFFYLVLT